MREPPPGAMARPIGELQAYFLDLRCAKCPRTVVSPLKLLAQRHGWRMTLDDLVRRLYCGKCKARPTVHLQERQAWGANGMGDVDHGWRTRVL